MAETPTWRQGYDAVERQLGPRLEQVVRSEQFAIAVGLLTRAQRTVEAESGRMTRRVLHRFNLPAGSDVTRILNEIGQLRHQVRSLNAELDATRAELAEARAAADAAPVTRPTPGTSAAATKAPAKKASAKKAPAKKAPAQKAAASKAARTGRSSRARTES